MYNVPVAYKKRLFFDGNSLFERGAGNLAYQYEAPFACHAAITGTKPPMFNKAISGKTVTQLITDYPIKMAPYIAPNDIVVFNEMVNSLAANRDVAATYADIISYRNLVWAQGAKFVIVTMTARGNGYPAAETDRLAINAMIRSNSAEWDGIADAGALSQFGSIAATANLTYYNADTLHFAAAGNTLYGQCCQPPIQLLLAA